LKAVELALVIERTGSPRAARPSLTARLAGQLRAAIEDGRLASGDRLPATRALAAGLGVSRTVVAAAYGQLFAEGWIEGRHGSGTYVTPGAAGRGGSVPAGPGLARPDPATGPAGPGAPHPAPIELRPGISWAAGINRAAWRRAWRVAGSYPPDAPADALGLAPLRHALTGYLRRARGMACDAGQVLVTRGVAASIGLVASAVLRPGDEVGVEEPGYPAARAVLGERGIRVIGCPADENGLVVESLPEGLRAVYTTPAHQYPLGGRLPVSRRHALLDWARKHDALVIEDDYDGEFRYDVAPLPTLFALDPQVVIYLGTTTKTLTPALRTGWLVARPDLVRVIAETAEVLGDRPTEAAQRAVLTLLGHGDLERHVRKMRHEYARRRSAACAALRGPTAARVVGDEAGLHLVLLTDREPGAIAAAAADQGVLVGTLDRYFAGEVTASGLVLGYGGASLPDVQQGCAILAAIIG